MQNYPESTGPSKNPVRSRLNRPIRVKKKSRNLLSRSQKPREKRPGLQRKVNQVHSISNSVTHVLATTAIDISSSTDEECDQNEPLSEIEKTPSPTRLPSAQGQINVILNQKPSSTLYSSNLDANLTFDAFLDRLDDCIARKTRQTKSVIQNAKKTYRYIWMTKSKSQQKTLPQYNDFETEEHYEVLQKELRTTSKRNPELDDMVLRFHIDVKVKRDDAEADEEGIDEEEPPSPSRASERQVITLTGCKLTVDRDK